MYYNLKELFKELKVHLPYNQIELNDVSLFSVTGVKLIDEEFAYVIEFFNQDIKIAELMNVKTAYYSLNCFRGLEEYKDYLDAPDVDIRLEYYLNQERGSSNARCSMCKEELSVEILGERANIDQVKCCRCNEIDRITDKIFDERDEVFKILTDLQ